MKTLVTHIMAKRALLCVAVMLVAACVHDPYSVVVIDANDVKAVAKVDRYIVKKGDTLYAIAFRYGTTVYALARSNGLAEPYTIFVGQSLLVPPSQGVSRSQSKSRIKPKPKSVVRTPTLAKLKSLVSREKTWVLPSRGTIAKGFSQGQNVHKGVDFKATKGSPVLAARSGKVVYAGNGLKAYGLLIIIKHDPHYLSAYAYNQRLSVREGDSVRQGQEIASVGRKGEQSLLHFEIRKNGKPIDPRRVLPTIE